MAHSPDFFVDDKDASALHDCVSRVKEFGYSEAGVRKRLGLDDINNLQLHASPIYRKEFLTKRLPLDIAIDLLLLQGTIQDEEMSWLFNTNEIEVLVRTGVLKIDSNNAFRAAMSLYPVGNRLFFSDHALPQLSQPESSNVPFDMVMFVGTDSRWLARATVRRDMSNALDLCSGSGIHGLLAAVHAKRVVAVDINPRAVRCTRFNALASGCLNLEPKEGDLYDVVDGERFDLITANPPFVPSPRNDLLFRDGGRSGEDIQRRIVAGLPAHLAPGGIAHIVTEVGERDGEPLADRIRQWLGGAPMDIHILRLRVHPAAVYAIGHAHGDNHAEFMESVGAWADNLRSQGYDRIVSLLCTVQWSDSRFGPPWDRVDEALPPGREAGGEIEAVFAAERLSRDPDLQENIRQGTLKRTGPVILLDGQVTGSDEFRSCKATLSGQALPIECRLLPLERNLLVAMNNPVDYPAILRVSRQNNISEPVLHNAFVSLLKKRLITLEFTGSAPSDSE